MLGAACKPPLNFYLSILAWVWKIQPRTRFPQNRPDLWGSNKMPLDVPLTLILHSVPMQVLLPKAQSNLRPSKPWFLRNCIPLQAHGLCSNWTFSVPACHIYPSLCIWTCNGTYSHEGNRRHEQGTVVPMETITGAHEGGRRQSCGAAGNTTACGGSAPRPCFGRYQRRTTCWLMWQGLHSARLLCSRKADACTGWERCQCHGLVRAAALSWAKLNRDAMDSANHVWMRFPY